MNNTNNNYFQIPKLLVNDSRFESLSVGAIFLYGLMSDRMNLSMKNGWKDKNNKVYIFFTIDEIQKCLKCGKMKSSQLLAELDKFGLISRVKQGLGKPARIYVQKFTHDTQEYDENSSSSQSNNGYSHTYQQKSSDYPQDIVSCTQVYQQQVEKESARSPENEPNVEKEGFRNLKSLLSGRKETSRNPENGHQEVQKTDSNNTDINNTDINNTDINNTNTNNCNNLYQYQSRETKTINKKESDKIDEDTMSKYRELIKNNIGYEGFELAEPHNMEQINEFVELIVDVMTSSTEYININREQKPLALVQSVFSKLNYHHISYVLDSLNQCVSKVSNIKSYLLTVLYNAPKTMKNWYTNRVQHDMYCYAD